MSLISKVIKGLGTFLVVLLLLAVLAFIFLEPPLVAIEDVGDWGEVDNEKIEVVSTLEIRNPNPIGVSLSNVNADYEIMANEVKLAEGEKNGIRLPKGNTTQTVSTDVLRENLAPWWVSHIRNSEKSNFTIKTRVNVTGLISGSADFPDHNQTITTDIIGVFQNSLNNTEGEYTAGVETETGIEPSVEIRETDAEWGKVTRKKTPIRMTFVVHNPNEYPVPVPSFSGRISMNQVEMINWEGDETNLLNVRQDSLIPPGESEEIHYEVEMQNSKIDDWFSSHVRNGEKTRLTSQISLSISVRGNKFEIPEEGGIECTSVFQTAILVDSVEPYNEFKGCGKGVVKAG